MAVEEATDTMSSNTTTEGRERDMTQSHSKATCSSQQHSQADQLKENANAAKANKTSKPPPINILGNCPQKTVDTIKARAKLVGNFSSKRINDVKHVIFTDNLSDYKLVLQLLKDVSIQFYSFTPKEEKVKTYLLKNIEGNFDEKDILNELKNQQIPELEFLKVAEFKTKNSIAKNLKLPMYIVQISSASKAAQLKQVNRLLH